MWSRPPHHPALRSLIHRLWASDGEHQPTRRELVLPTGAMHLVLRLADEPLRLYDGPGDATGSSVATAVVGGARSAAYLRDVSRPVPTVGAQLHPGAACFFFAPPADVLAERHLPLEDLWGGFAAEAREQLAAAPTPEARIERFEALLVARLRAGATLHPAIAAALRRLGAGEAVGEVAAATGWSHRHFVARFRAAVGLHPKAWARVVRLQRALQLRTASPAMQWAELALAAGYADQSHLIREFGLIASLTPGGWSRQRPRYPAHVPFPG